MRRLTILAMCAAATLGAGCGDDEGEEPAAENPPAEQQSGSTAEGGCEQVEAPQPKPDGDEKKPTTSLKPAGTYDVEMQTSCGAFTIRLDQKASPRTAASFAELTRRGFFDGTVFHRIVPGFVIQGGDPTASGQGGPGYSTVDKPPADARYTRGVVAMAKTQTEPPGTSGSQFYVVTGQDAGLSPDYAVLGKVVEGQDVVQRIGEQGDPATEMPLQPVVIEKATLSEG